MIILASTSPTRQAMLRHAGLVFSAESPRVDERALAAHHPHWTPQDVAVELAAAKACEVSSRHPGALVIGADQVLAMGPKIYSKPRDLSDCRAQLLELRGKSHILFSAVSAARDGDRLWAHHDGAYLTMRDFSDQFLERYLAAVGHDCTSSVGGYKIEGLGVQLFQSIEGDHFTILGLPLLALLDWLRRSGEIPA